VPAKINSGMREALKITAPAGKFPAVKRGLNRFDIEMRGFHESRGAWLNGGDNACPVKEGEIVPHREGDNSFGGAGAAVAGAEETEAEEAGISVPG